MERRSRGWRNASVAVLLMGLLLSCGQRPVDYFDSDFQKPLGWDQLLYKSSLVVVGTVKEIEVVRSGVPARRDPELLLDETQVDLDVENVLLGDWRDPKLKFVFFGFSTKNRGGYSGPALYRVLPGERAIFFLTVDQGLLRSVADVRDYHIPVWSGLHRNFRRSTPPQQIPGTANLRLVGDDISAILLEIGESPSLDGMVSSIRGFPPVTSDLLSSRKRTVARLLRLTDKKQNNDLRVRACQVLVENYTGQSACLFDLEKDTSLSPKQLLEIADLKRGHAERKARLKEALQRAPILAFSMESVEFLRDEFQMLASDPDPALRQLACEILKRDFGQVRVTGCPEVPAGR